jgi:hypothetical protein
MNMFTTIVIGSLTLFLAIFTIRLSYNIIVNITNGNGRKFHQALEQEFSKLRLNNMLAALGINKTDYIYQTNVKDIHQQMKNCTDCTNTTECDEKVATSDIDITEIEFCNNEEELQKIKHQQSTHE